MHFEEPSWVSNCAFGTLGHNSHVWVEWPWIEKSYLHFIVDYTPWYFLTICCNLLWKRKAPEECWNFYGGIWLLNEIMWNEKMIWNKLGLSCAKLSLASAKLVKAWKLVKHKNLFNTSLLGKGALAHRLQRPTACKFQNGHQNEENSGHYVIASSQLPERPPLERRTLVPFLEYLIENVLIFLMSVFVLILYSHFLVHWWDLSG